MIKVYGTPTYKVECNIQKKKNCFLTDLLLLACLNFELCLEIDEIFHLQIYPSENDDKRNKRKLLSAAYINVIRYVYKRYRCSWCILNKSDFLKCIALLSFLYRFR